MFEGQEFSDNWKGQKNPYCIHTCMRYNIQIRRRHHLPQMKFQKICLPKLMVRGTDTYYFRISFIPKNVDKRSVSKILSSQHEMRTNSSERQWRVRGFFNKGRTVDPPGFSKLYEELLRCPTFQVCSVDIYFWWASIFMVDLTYADKTQLNNWGNRN